MLNYIRQKKEQTETSKKEDEKKIETLCVSLAHYRRYGPL